MSRHKASHHRDWSSSWVWPAVVSLISTGGSAFPLGMAARYGWIGHWPRALALLAVCDAIATAGCLLAMLIIYLQGQQVTH